MQFETSREKPNWAANCLLLACCLLGAFALHGIYINVPFYADDYSFLPPRMVPGSLSEFVSFWNPWRGWFYRPTFLSYMWGGLFLWGESAVAFHVAGLVGHGLVAWLLALFVGRLSGVRLVSWGSAALYLMWANGRDEAFFWVASHSTLLAAIFSLLCLHAWFFAVQHHSRVVYAGAALCFWLALCSKNDAAALLVAVMALDWALSPHRFLVWLRSRALPLLGMVAVFAFWFACEWIAAKTYAATGDKYVSTFYHFPLRTRLRAVEQFAGTISFGFIRLGGWSTLPAIAGVIAAIYATRSRSAAAMGLWTVAAMLPVPLASVWHAFNGGRFWYYPVIPLVAFGVVMLWELSKRLGARRFTPALILGTATLLAVLLTPVAGALRTNDPVLLWGVLFALLAVFAMCWRAGFAPTWAFGLGLLVAVAPQVEMMAVFSPWGHIAAYGLVVGALAVRGQWSAALIGGLFILTGWEQPANSVFILLCLSVIQTWIERAKVNSRTTTAKGVQVAPHALHA